MPLARQELASAVLNGKLYVIGGYYLGFESTTSVQVYNPATDTWALAHPLPYVVNHNSAAVAGGKLYSFGAGGRCLFTIRTTTLGARSLPPIMYTATLRRWE
jgi:hypothetical protein